jgi:hypothetical protein
MNIAHELQSSLDACHASCTTALKALEEFQRRCIDYDTIKHCRGDRYWLALSRAESVKLKLTGVCESLIALTKLQTQVLVQSTSTSTNGISLKK